MVGEIRDLETAQIAVQAALTGHLVLSTLHTNSAAATHHPAARHGAGGLSADRRAARRAGAAAGPPAVRRTAAATSRRRRNWSRASIWHDAASGGPVTLWHPVGCPQCRNTGYRGRPRSPNSCSRTPAIERLIFAQRRPQRDRAGGGRRPAWRRMFDAGICGRAGGETTIEEVMRAASGRRAEARCCRSATRARPWPARRQRGLIDAPRPGRGRRAAAAPGQHADARRAGTPARGLPGRPAALRVGGARRLTPPGGRRLTRELAIMLGAGQDLDRALRFLVETAPNARVARRASTACATRCATARRSPPRWRSTRSFPRLYIGLVRAGEAGGKLAPTLDASGRRCWNASAASPATVTSAMIYPALLVVAAIGSIALLLTQVLPQFVPLFEQSGAALPRLHAVPDRCRRHRRPTTGSMRAGVLAARAGRSRQVLRRPGAAPVSRIALLLRLPIVGRLQREVLAARFTRTLGTLLINGVPLIARAGHRARCVGQSRRGRRDRPGQHAGAKGGGGLSAAAGGGGIFPARTIHLLRLGEENAQLGPMALRAAEIHEERTRLRRAAPGRAAGAGDHHPDGRGGRGHRRLAAAGDAEPQRPGRRLRG